MADAVDDGVAVPRASAPVVGAPAPDYRAPSSKGHTLGPDTFEDRLAVVLFFLPDLDRPEARARCWAFDATLSEFGGRRVQLLGVVTATPSQLRDDAEDTGVTLLADEDGSITAAFGVDADTPVVVVVDRRGVVAAVMRGDDAHPEAVLREVDRLLEERPDDVAVHPDGSTPSPPAADAAGPRA